MYAFNFYIRVNISENLSTVCIDVMFKRLWLLYFAAYETRTYAG
jgi:hypothetical protein